MSDSTIADIAREPDEVARFLVALRALGDEPAPAPAHAVAALIGGVAPVRAHLYRRLAVRAALVAAAVLAALVGAAANHSLPQPAQRVVSNVVNDLTPFDIGPGQPAGPPATPTHTHKPEPDRSRADNDPSGTDEPSDQRGESDDNSTGPTRGDDGSVEPGSTPERDSGDRTGTRTSEPQPTPEPTDGSEPRER